MEGGTLFISRNVKIFSIMKFVFDECGFEDVILSSFENYELAALLNKIKPKNVFINSGFYSAATSYMIGCLISKFPDLNLHVINFGYYPDKLAVRFIFHGAKSYFDINYGVEEFRNGLKKIKLGQKYYSPNVQSLIDKIEVIPNLKRALNDREWEVLFLVCNGFENNQIAVNLKISKRTVNYLIHNIYKLFDGVNRRDLIRKTLCLGWIDIKQLGFHGTDIKIPPRIVRAF